MADDIHIKGGTPSRTKILPETTGTPSKQIKGYIAPPVSGTNGKPVIPDDKKPDGKPPIPGSTNPNSPTEAEAQQALQRLRDRAQTIKETIYLNAQNVYALFNMYENTKKVHLSQDDVFRISELFAGKSPQEVLEYCNTALLKTAIGPDGQFTPEFIAFLENPNFEAVTDSNKEKIRSFCALTLLLDKISTPPPPGEEKEFSFFDLMILLNKLSSSQRDAMFKGAWAEQALLELKFDQQKETTKTKAITSAAITISTGIAGGLMSLGGNVLGGLKGGKLTEHAGAQAFISAGSLISQTGSGAERGISGTVFETKLIEIEKEKSGAGFHKETYSATQRSMQEQGNNANQIIESYIRDTRGVQSAMAQKMT